MGALRIIGIVVVTFFLAIFLLGAVVSYTATQLTSADILEPAVEGIVMDLLEERGLDVDEAYDELIENCDSGGGGTLSEELEGADGTDIELDCDALKAAGSAGVIDLFVDTFIEQIDTLIESDEAEESFGDAIPFGGLNIFSDQNKKYMGYALIGFTILSALAILGLVFLSKPKYKALIPVGVAGIIFGIPFGLLYLAEGKLAAIESEAIRGIASSALGIVRTNAMIAFIAGAVLLVTGIVLTLVLKSKGGSTSKVADKPKKSKEK